MKKILLLATGGTIASRPTAAGGLAPAITSEELLACVPELADLCAVDAVQVFNLDSTNVGPAQWQSIVHCIKENYDAYDGFVIAHGTDTMAYTAAALSYMVQNSAKPVVLTGSQKSIYNRDTDARNNLYRAFVYAVSDGAWGVQLVFDNKVILGTRARKTRTRSFNAFSSIDYPETAVFRDTRLVLFLRRPAALPPVRFYEKLDPAVFVLRLVPGMRADIIPMLAPHYRALVLESFGVGGLPGGEHHVCRAAPLVRERAAGGVYNAGSPRGLRPCRLRGGARRGRAARRIGGPRHDPRGRRRETDVGAGPDRRPRGSNAVV